MQRSPRNATNEKGKPGTFEQPGCREEYYRNLDYQPPLPAAVDVRDAPHFGESVLPVPTHTAAGWAHTSVGLFFPRFPPCFVAWLGKVSAEKANLIGDQADMTAARRIIILAVPVLET